MLPQHISQNSSQYIRRLDYQSIPILKAVHFASSKWLESSQGCQTLQAAHHQRHSDMLLKLCEMLMPIYWRRLFILGYFGILVWLAGCWQTSELFSLGSLNNRIELNWLALYHPSQLTQLPCFLHFETVSVGHSKVQKNLSFITASSGQRTT